MNIGQIITTVIVPAVTAVTGGMVLLLDSQVKAVDNKLKIRQEDRLDVAAQRDSAQQVSASPGYNITGLVIRREPQEAEAAESIKAVVDSAVSGKAGFLLAGSRQRTPGYISLFVC
jgi:hypothetical protein